MAKRDGLLGIGLLAFAAVAGSACSFLVDARVTDCTRDSDCASKGESAKCRISAGAGAGRCVQLDGRSCERTGDCRTDGGAVPTVCRVPNDGGTLGVCVALRTDECDTVIGNWQSDNAFVIGSILPTKGDDLSSGLACQNAIRMAIEEFPSGLPATPGEGARRPIVLVGCNDGSDQEQGVRAARHLAEVGVPAIIGAQWSGITRRIAEDVTIANGILLVSPSSTAATLTNLEDHGLVWRTAPSDTFQAEALVQYVPVVEQFVRTQSGNPQKKIKLMIVYQSSDYGKGLSWLISNANMNINGQSLSQNQEQGLLAGFEYGDKTAGDVIQTDRAVEAILGFGPDIVVNLCTAEGVNKIFVPVEMAWPTLRPGVPGPRWIFGDGGKTGAVTVAVGANDELRRRVTGTVPGSDRPLFENFKVGYKIRFVSDLLGTDPTALGPAGAYDALYLLAFSATTLGTRPVTGPNLASGMTLLVRGQTAVDVGPVGVTTAFRELGAGRNIDFAGASGPLDFDLATGEAPSDIQVWCMPRGADGKAINGVNSGIYLDAVTRRLQGTAYGPPCGFD